MQSYDQIDKFKLISMLSGNSVFKGFKYFHLILLFGSNKYYFLKRNPIPLIYRDYHLFLYSMS